MFFGDRKMEMVLITASSDVLFSMETLDMKVAKEQKNAERGFGEDCVACSADTVSIYTQGQFCY